MGDGDNKTMQMTNFLVIDNPSALNAIFGRPPMKKTKMHVAPYSLQDKFLTPYDITPQRKDHEVNILAKAMSTLECLDLKEGEKFVKPEPVEITEIVEFYLDEHDKCTKIVPGLAKKDMRRLIRLL
ncbi:hypothetical protein V6N13_107077 [Hibiscus sabdariffa]|uniref:Uncharacterized protein n=1 Tax=Hibiscus sabdariffa TaxID=183260 RepID=A0ABR2F2T2_9ROSI